jgi:GH15 family glucan-1,4-alpha-glucosidase
MCWVAVDRGLRLSEKRMFPCLDRAKWMRTRDEIYLAVMDKGWDPLGCHFTQSFGTAVLDSSVLIMPLVFFMSPSDPRLLSTIAAILCAPERGGLTTNNLVHRYSVSQVDDGLHQVGEGTFTLCTFWLVEALTRAGKYLPKYLARALYTFDQTLSFGNHLLLFSEQISPSGEIVGNFPQAFTHVCSL